MRPLTSRALCAATLLAAALTLLPVALRAQQPDAYVIEGRVFDAVSRAALQNLRVSLRGTDGEVHTDGTGRYRLFARVPQGTYTVDCAAIGYKRATRQVELAAIPTVTVPDVFLERTAVMLDGVVVTGVGVPAERRVLGNSIETVSGVLVGEAPGATAVDQALRGKITGAIISENSGQPGGGVSVRRPG